MAKVISQEQAALLSNLVYAVSTEGINKGNFIFDNSEVTEKLILKSYISIVMNAR